MNNQEQITREELNGLFSKDQWLKMSYGTRDAFYKRKLRDGCAAILNGEAKDLEEYMKKEIIETGIYSKSWSKFRRKNPSISGNIYDAQDEIVSALNIMGIARNNPAQAMDRLSSKNDWKYINKSQILNKINGFLAERNGKRDSQTGGAAMPGINGLVNWAKLHPLAVGGIGLAGYYLFIKHEK